MNGVFRYSDGTIGHNSLHCRVCGFEIDAATCVNSVDAVPSPGAFSVCFNCGEVSIYLNGPLGVALREPTLDELQEFARDFPGLAQALHQYRAQR